MHAGQIVDTSFEVRERRGGEVALANVVTITPANCRLSSRVVDPDTFRLEARDRLAVPYIFACSIASRRVAREDTVA
jgi:hypothetical protein